MKVTAVVLLISLLSVSGQSGAEAASGALEPPVIPPQVESGEALEPQVTIIQRSDATIYEYRINTRVYMVKIVPNAGPAYYLLDTDGDGELDVERDTIHDISIPQWVLFSW